MPPFPASWLHTHLLPSCSVPQIRFPVEGSQDVLFTPRARSSHVPWGSRQQEMLGGGGGHRSGVSGPRGNLHPLFQISSSLHEIIPHRNNTQKSVFTPHPSSPQGGITPRPLSTGPHLRAGFLPEFPSPLTKGTRLNPLPAPARV